MKERKVLTRHSRAVSIICVASRLCTKLGGNAEDCLVELTVAGTVGSEMYTVCIEVVTCLRLTWR